MRVERALAWLCRRPRERQRWRDSGADVHGVRERAGDSPGAWLGASGPGAVALSRRRTGAPAGWL